MSQSDRDTEDVAGSRACPGRDSDVSHDGLKLKDSITGCVDKHVVTEHKVEPKSGGVAKCETSSSNGGGLNYKAMTNGIGDDASASTKTEKTSNLASSSVHPKEVVPEVFDSLAVSPKMLQNNDAIGVLASSAGNRAPLLMDFVKSLSKEKLEPKNSLHSRAGSHPVATKESTDKPTTLSVITNCNGVSMYHADVKSTLPKVKTVHPSTSKHSTSMNFNSSNPSPEESISIVQMCVESKILNGVSISPSMQSSSEPQNRTKYVTDSEVPSTSRAGISKPKKRRNRSPLKTPPATLDLPSPSRVVEEPPEPYPPLDIGSNESPDSGIQSVGSPDHESSPRHQMDVFILPQVEERIPAPPVSEISEQHVRETNNSLSAEDSTSRDKWSKPAKAPKVKRPVGRPPKLRIVSEDGGLFPVSSGTGKIDRGLQPGKTDNAVSVRNSVIRPKLKKPRGRPPKINKIPESTTAGSTALLELDCATSQPNGNSLDLNADFPKTFVRARKPVITNANKIKKRRGRPPKTGKPPLGVSGNGAKSGVTVVKKRGRPKGALNKKTILKMMSGCANVDQTFAPIVRTGVVNATDTQHKTKDSTSKLSFVGQRPAKENHLNYSAMDTFIRPVVKRKPGRPRRQPVSGLNQVATYVCDNKKPGTDLSATPDSDFNSLMLSVRASIDSQFSASSADTGFNLDLSPVLNSRKAVEDNTTAKRKYKKPKVHVMMRTHKHRKRRKRKNVPQTSPVATCPQPVHDNLPSSLPVDQPLNIDVGSPSDAFLSPFRSQGSSSKHVLGAPSSFASVFSFSASPKMASPTAFSPKAFSPKASTNGPLLAGPDDVLWSDCEKLSESACNSSRKKLSSVTSDVSEPSGKIRSSQLSRLKRARKKKRKMLNLKSKHKNIVDPVFLAEMDDLSALVTSLALSPSCETSMQNIAKDALPDMFRLDKNFFSVSKKSESVPSLGKPKTGRSPGRPPKAKPAKGPVEHQQVVYTVPKIVGNPPRIIDAPVTIYQEVVPATKVALKKQAKRNGKNPVGRPRKHPIEDTVVNVPSSFSKSAHCLPPKKRHKLLAASQASSDQEVALTSTTGPIKQKVKRGKKATSSVSDSCEAASLPHVQGSKESESEGADSENKTFPVKSQTKTHDNKNPLKPQLSSNTTVEGASEHRSLFEVFREFNTQAQETTNKKTSTSDGDVLRGTSEDTGASTLLNTPKKQLAKELKTVNLEEVISPHKLSTFTGLKKPRKNSAGGGYNERMKALFHGSSTLVSSGCLNIDKGRSPGVGGATEMTRNRKRFHSEQSSPHKTPAVSPKKRRKSERDVSAAVETPPALFSACAAALDTVATPAFLFGQVVKRGRGRPPGSKNKIKKSDTDLVAVAVPAVAKRRGRPPGSKTKNKLKPPKEKQLSHINNLAQKIKKRVGRPPKDPFRRQLFYKGINVSKLGIQNDGVSEIFANNKKFSDLLLDESSVAESEVTSEKHSTVENGCDGLKQVDMRETDSTTETSNINEKQVQLVEDNRVIGTETSDSTACVNTLKPKRTIKVSRAKKLRVKKKSHVLEADSQPERSLDSECQPLPLLKRKKRKVGRPKSDKNCTIHPTAAQESPQESPVLNRKSRKRKKRFARPPKKKYQKVGLFSNYYKQDHPEETSEASQSKLTDADKAEYRSGTLDEGLLPPPFHVGRYLRETVKDFCLPYDIWWEHTYKRMSSGKPLSPKYKKIRHNVHVDDEKPYCRDERHACTCQRPSSDVEAGCTEDCLNRMIYTECTPSMCPCGDKCSNQKIQKHEWCKGLQKFLTKDRGYGVHCIAPIKTAQFIVEYVGEVVSEREFRRRMTEQYANDDHHYCLHLSSGAVIDGYRMGNVCRFVNHSCRPNCEMQKWNVNGVYRMGLFALQDITPGCELTYDYNFHAYNLDSQQICKCGSLDCRGIMGGRTQRLNGLLRDKSMTPKPKRGRKSKKALLKKIREKKVSESQSRVKSQSAVKPMSHRERCFAQKHAIFLVRNMEKIRRQRNRASLNLDTDIHGESFGDYSFSEKDVFMSKFNALHTARSVRTRRLTVAEGSGEVTKTARLAQVFKDMFTAVTSCKDEKGNLLSLPLMNIPPRTRNPDYYEIVKDPIDLNSIEKNILTGYYKNVELFDEDILRLFSNVETYCSHDPNMCHLVLRLRKVYQSAKMEAGPLFEEILGGNWEHAAQSEEECSKTPTPTAELTTEVTGHDPGEADTVELPPLIEGVADVERDEVIRCACNIFVDEGLMIQCDTCQMWQHADCMGVGGDQEKYVCELCGGYDIDPEILLKPQPHDGLPGCTYYITLMKDGNQIRAGHCVYLLREGDLDRVVSVTDGSAPSRDNMDVFRVERLWKNERGEKFAFGHHFYRPHETYHEPSRRFFPNEVFRVPLYELVPLQAIVGTCVVMDLHSYCRGRPKSVHEQDVYICEYRLDKTAHLFAKISRSSFPINTFPYCFDTFERRLTPKRTYTPHIVPSAYRRRGAPHSTQADNKHKGDNCGADDDQEEDLPLAKVKEAKIKKKKEHLANVHRKLLHFHGIDLATLDSSWLCPNLTPCNNNGDTE